jgi:hypothetical protein
LKQTERRVRCRWSPTLLIAGALAAGSLAGCVPLRGYSSVVVTPPSSRSAASGVPAVMAADSSLAAIIDNQIQSGHYARAEQSLRKYLKRHPDDRAAQGMLRQLTVDPEQWLGHRSRTHVVQPGDSYSTLQTRRNRGDEPAPAARGEEDITRPTRIMSTVVAEKRDNAGPKPAR